MSSQRIIKCNNCGTFNTNKDYCENCNSLISHQKKRELKEAKFRQSQIEEARFKIENPGIAERLKKHPSPMYRALGWLLYSAMMMVSIIGAGIAWFVAMIAAG